MRPAVSILNAAANTALVTAPGASLTRERFRVAAAQSGDERTRLNKALMAQVDPEETLRWQGRLQSGCTRAFSRKYVALSAIARIVTVKAKGWLITMQWTFSFERLREGHHAVHVFRQL